ncbi:hypothetical protein [Mycobacterium sp.]|uniref:hypothetical protein n=1 Tax=Mycobacterium sp. TaxID=1785 RepID=UPI002BA403A4|nr:hypothetical protein [Mycobacterium sp.]HKP44444.1 hypothetical protein [Mycobacterium sp.]
MRDQIEAVQAKRIGKPVDSIDFGVVGGRRDDAVSLCQRRYLMAPARRALRIPVQKKHRLPLAGPYVEHNYFVQISIKLHL